MTITYLDRKGNFDLHARPLFFGEHVTCGPMLGAGCPLIESSSSEYIASHDFPGLGSAAGGPDHSIEGSFWISGWVRVNPQAAQTLTIIQHDSSGNLDSNGTGLTFSLAYRDTGVEYELICQRMKSNDVAAVARSEAFNLDPGWHFFWVSYVASTDTWAFGMDGATLSNGSIFFSAVMAGRASAPSAAIGQRIDNSYRYSVAMIAWGNGEPTAAALNALWTSRNSGPATYETDANAIAGCISYWPMDETARGTYVDASGNFVDQDNTNASAVKSTGLVPNADCMKKIAFPPGSMWDSACPIPYGSMDGDFTILGMIADPDGAVGVNHNFIHIYDDLGIEKITIRYRNDPVDDQFFMGMTRDPGTGTEAFNPAELVPALSAGPHMWAVKFNVGASVFRVYLDGALVMTDDQPGSSDVCDPSTAQAGNFLSCPVNSKHSHLTFFGEALSDSDIADAYAASLVDGATLVSTLMSLPTGS